MNESENYPYFTVRTATGLALTFADKEIICHNNHIIINNMTKSASATASKTPPKKASTPVKSYSTSPKKGVEEKKTGP
jgi:hypothetical protein